MTNSEEPGAPRASRKLIWYLAVPILSALAMVSMYFSGVPFLRQIITPTMEGMYANSQREFGLLENLQNIFLLDMVAFAIRGAVRGAPHIRTGGPLDAGHPGSNPGRAAFLTGL